MAIETVYTRTPGEASAALSAAVLGVTTGVAIETDAAGTIQQYLRGLVAMAADEQAVVANAPASPGQVTTVAVNTALEATAADLVPGVKYVLQYVPDVPTDFVRGAFKCAAAASPITSLTDGQPWIGNTPYTICLPSGSTKVRVHFMRDSSTPFDGKMYLSLASS